MKTIRLLPLAIAATLPLAACGPSETAVTNNTSEEVLSEEGTAGGELGANTLDANLTDANLVDANASIAADPLANDTALNGTAPANGF